MMDGFRKEGVMTWRNECAGAIMEGKGIKKLAGTWILRALSAWTRGSTALELKNTPKQQSVSSEQMVISSG